MSGPAQEPGANIRSVVPFFNVSDMQRSLRYYIDGLGFAIRSQWVVDGAVRWCWIERGGAALMLQQFVREGSDSWVPEGKVGDGVSLWFICDDALAMHADLQSRGIECSEPQVGNGMWVTMLADPDGYKLNFESPTHAPEDIKLSELP